MELCPKSTMKNFTITLNDSNQIPIVGLGTSRMQLDKIVEVVKYAIDIGYRHFDTAYFYNNEKQLGTAITEKILEGSVKRDELFITTKLWCTFHHPDDVELALSKSLNNLGLEYVDLYLIHFPIAFKRGEAEFGRILYDHNDFEKIDYMDTWKAMEKVLKKGLTKSIGISNFNKHQVSRILEQGEIVPAVLQIQRNPYVSNNDITIFCQQKGIHVIAHSPLHSPNNPLHKHSANLLLESKLLDLAKKYSKSPAQIALRWQVQSGICVIPKTITKERLEQNLDIFDFDLLKEDMAIIDGLERDLKYCYVRDADEYLLELER